MYVSCAPDVPSHFLPSSLPPFLPPSLSLPDALPPSPSLPPPPLLPPLSRSLACGDPLEDRLDSLECRKIEGLSGAGAVGANPNAIHARELPQI